jgi:hypothetical protein
VVVAFVRLRSMAGELMETVGFYDICANSGGEIVRIGLGCMRLFEVS